MKRHAIPTAIGVFLLVFILSPASVLGQAIPGAAGAGIGPFPPGTVFSGIPLNGLQFGMGAFIPGDSTAAGGLQATLLGTSLLGQPQNIEVQGQATNGALNVDGSRTLSGLATVDLGDGSPPQTNVPFTATATATSLLLAINNLGLPAVALSGGVITIQ